MEARRAGRWVEEGYSQTNDCKIESSIPRFYRNRMAQRFGLCRYPVILCRCCYRLFVVVVVFVDVVVVVV